MNRREFLAALPAVSPVVALAAEAIPAAPEAAAVEVREHSLADLAGAQASGAASAESLTAAYLERIARLDRAGPELRAVLALNPDALAAARALDAERRQGRVRGPLHGIPLLLKDNIETRDPLPTTAGSLALAASRHAADAPLAARLRAAGAVVLGKANLSEWANFRSTHAQSGWSGVGGQTRNAYDPARTPSGSSSGSAVGVAANLCAAAIGTETDGSILSPASLNGVVGLKPTHGLVDGRGIVPITSRQDTAGPIARTVADAAQLLGVIADPAVRWDGVGGVGAPSSPGRRLGVFAPSATSHPAVAAAWPEWLRVLERAGHTLVDVRVPRAWQAMGEAESQAMLWDFRDEIDAYLAAQAPEVTVRSLAALVEFNAAHAEAELGPFGQELFEQALRQGPRHTAAYQRLIAGLVRAADTDGLARLFARERLDALVAPGNGPADLIDPVWRDRDGGGWPEMSSAAAIAGYPSLSVPAGFVGALPVSLHMVAPRFCDGRLLELGRTFERDRGARRPPAFG